MRVCFLHKESLYRPSVESQIELIICFLTSIIHVFMVSADMFTVYRSLTLG